MLTTLSIYFASRIVGAWTAGGLARFGWRWVRALNFLKPLCSQLKCVWLQLQ
jgi:hypothetical protein